MGKYFWMYAANIIQIFHMTLMILFPREIILQMFVGNCLQLWTWQPGMMHDAHTGMHINALETNFTLFCALLWIKTLRWSLMVPIEGKFILKFWKAICFRFSGITADIVSEIFPVWKVRVSPSECSNIGKLFEWKILLLCCCQGGNYKSFWLSAWNWNLQ